MTYRVRFVVKGKSTEPLSKEIVFGQIHKVLTDVKLDLSYLIVEEEVQ